MDRSTTPNAFILGVAKAGTTSLARYLGSHPDIYVPETKEPNHYLLRVRPHNTVGPASPEVVHFMLHRFSVSERDNFEKLYAPGASFPVRIDASVRYLYHPEALAEIVHEHPDARHIVVLRDPAERALSHWRMNREYHLEPLEFADALAAEDERVAAGWGWDWHYRRLGTYEPQLRELFRRVPRDQVRIVFYGDFLREPRRTLEECCEFLGVRTGVPIDLSKTYRAPQEPRWAMLHRMMSHPTKVRGAVRRLPGGARIADRIQDLNTRSVGAADVATVSQLRSACEPDLGDTAALLEMSLPSLSGRIASRIKG